MIGAFLVLALVTAERVGELWLAQHNTRRLLANGAVAHADEHYPLLIALHAAWLAGLWLFAWDRPLDLLWLGAFGLLQILRVWVLTTLKDRWTTRIITMPNEILVKRGPYRFLEHPNYAVVIGEIAVLPLVFGLWRFAIVFSILNAAVLFIRIRAENNALAALRGD